MIRIADIADALEAGLSARERQLALEQAVSGLDALDELRLHPVLAECLAGAGYGVHREQRYPRDRVQRRRSEGERCDLVLTPDGRPLRHPDEPPSLFAPAEAVELEEAFWVEVKCVPQHLCEGPNPRYAAELLQPVRADVVKLAGDEGIRHAVLALILFTADRETAEHDLAAWARYCLDRGVLVAPPSVRHIDLVDRIGNRVCTVALFEVVRGCGVHGG